LLIVRQATQTVLSLQSMVTRHTGQSVGCTALSKWTLREVRATFGDSYSQQTTVALLRKQRRIQHGLEKQVLAAVASPYRGWLTTGRCDWQRPPPIFRCERGLPVLPASRASEGWTLGAEPSEPENCEDSRVDTMRY